MAIWRVDFIGENLERTFFVDATAAVPPRAELDLVFDTIEVTINFGQRDKATSVAITKLGDLIVAT